MGRIQVNYLSGKKENYYGGTSVYKGNLYIWAMGGDRKNKKPIKVIPLKELHSLKKTGQKAFTVSK